MKTLTQLAGQQLFGPPPRTIVAIIRDKDERIDVDRFRGISKSSPQSIRLLRLRKYVEDLAIQWAAYEAGFDWRVAVPMRDALGKIESEEKRTNFLDRTQPWREELTKEGKITERLLKNAETRLRNAGTPERKIRTMIAREAGITRARADQILGAVKTVKTKARG